MIFEISALFACGTFYGAALYISLAQHPAALEAGIAVGGRFFPPMYKRAAPLQIAMALAGFLAGLVVLVSKFRLSLAFGRVVINFGCSYYVDSN